MLLMIDRKNLMSSKSFILQRISAYSGKEIDPCSDQQVVELLQRKFNIYLPQRPTLEDSLTSATSDHEIIGLILEYRKQHKLETPNSK